MFANRLIKLNPSRLTHRQQCGLLDHKKMEELKKKLFTDREKTLLLKAKFILKEAKYTLVQGSKDLWRDAKWIVNLYKTKESIYFTGYELLESQRVKIDMLKFIPYSVILVVPFAELALPIILWLFPNAVPSFYLFDTAEDNRIERYEHTQLESHKFLIEKLIDVMTTRFKLSQIDFSRYEFFKEGYFEIIDELDQHLHFKNFSSDELIKVLEFLGGGDFVTGTASINKIVNLFTLNIPRVTLKILRYLYSKLLRVKLEPYEDPWFIKGDFSVFKFNFFPFEFFKRRFLLWQIRRKFTMIWLQDRAF